MDDYSRAICGYTVFTGAPSALNTALALRQAIWRKSDPSWAMCGLPDVLYVDHGSDFTSHHLDRTAVELHIRLIHSTVARPQGRGKIERFFGTVNTKLLTTLPGHLGPCTRTPAPALDLSALDHAVGGFVVTYNDRPHREIGSSPRDAWVGDGWLPRMPDSLEQLDGLLLTVPKHRTVQRDGIHFQGQRYLSPTLAAFVGHPVTIRYDPRDLSEIRVYDRNTFGLPPAADRGDGERGGVVVGADRHPAGVAAHVVDAVGVGLAQLGVDEVVDFDLLRIPGRAPLGPAVLVLPNEFAG